jgi:formamidopyrimidine-DNA glycosylase
MFTIAQMVAQGYRFGAPTQQVEEMDAQVAEGQKCRKCDGPMHYEGYHRRTRGWCEYVALAVCNSCGHELAF